MNNNHSELLECNVKFQIILISLCGGKRCVWVLLQTDTFIYTWLIFHHPGLINNYSSWPPRDLGQASTAHNLCSGFLHRLPLCSLCFSFCVIKLSSIHHVRVITVPAPGPKCQRKGFHSTYFNKSLVKWCFTQISVVINWSGIRLNNQLKLFNHDLSAYGRHIETITRSIPQSIILHS